MGMIMIPITMLALNALKISVFGQKMRRNGVTNVSAK
jgi:hypothetical protein